LDPTPNGCPEEPPHDPNPVPPVEDQKRPCRSQVEQNQEGQEGRVGLLEAPVEEARDDDRVAKRGDREELGGPLQEPDQRGLPGGQLRRGQRRRRETREEADQTLLEPRRNRALAFLARRSLCRGGGRDAA